MGKELGGGRLFDGEREEKKELTSITKAQG